MPIVISYLFPPPPLHQVCVPWVQPGLRCGGDEEPRSCGEPSPGGPAGGRSGEGGSPLEGTCLQEWMHPGETSSQCTQHVCVEDHCVFPLVVF